MDTRMLCDDIEKNFYILRDQTILAMNKNLLYIYWHTGKIIADAIDSCPNPEPVLREISENLRNRYERDFSKENLYEMMKFYRAIGSFSRVNESLSWSHYKLISDIEEKNERYFYIIECASNKWSAPELYKRINEKYYHTLYTSSNMSAVRKKMQSEITPTTLESLLSDFNVFNFCI